jgi:ABC-2 type transport system ATP-binding protein
LGKREARVSATDGHLAVVPETNGGQPAIWTRGLTKRYRRVTALDDCSITVPEGRISALVGPNGAGKTTLLRMLAGLARPTAGSAAVLGARPRQDPAFLAGIGYLAQEIPLYRRLTAEDYIRAGARLNDRWDSAASRARLRELGVPLGRAAGRLSGGQRGQLALTLALAKRPRLLLLDEPVAALDPLARRHFLGALTAAVADAAGELTVLLSSHLISELERVCDHIVVSRTHRYSCAETSRTCSRSTGCSPGRARTPPASRPCTRSCTRPRPAASRRCSSGSAAPCSTPPTRCPTWAWKTSCSAT